MTESLATSRGRAPLMGFRDEAPQKCNTFSSLVVDISSLVVNTACDVSICGEVRLPARFTDDIRYETVGKFTSFTYLDTVEGKQK